MSTNLAFIHTGHLSIRCHHASGAEHPRPLQRLLNYQIARTGTDPFVSRTAVHGHNSWILLSNVVGYMAGGEPTASVRLVNVCYGEVTS
jgi:hypothetical protein